MEHILPILWINRNPFVGLEARMPGPGVGWRDARRVMSKRRVPYFPAGRQRKTAVLLEGMRAGKLAVVLVAVKLVAEV